MELRNHTQKKHHTFLRHSILLLNLIAPPITLYLLLNHHPLPALLTLLTAHTLFLIPTLIPQNTWCGPTLSQLNPTHTQNRHVWLTIDDGPHPTDTPLLLDLLDQYQAKATFFFIGQKAQQHPHLVQQVIQRGHTLGNHTMTHPQHHFWHYLPSQLHQEITQCQQTLQQITPHHPPIWFRAPAGLKNPFIHPILTQQNLHLTTWNTRGLDGIERNPQKILNRLLPQIRPGSIILMHEARQDHQGNRLAPQILQAILQHLQTHHLIPTIPTEP